MKLPFRFSDSDRGGRLKPDQGFTLPEILIATTVFLLMITGIIVANLFGLRMFQITETKLNAITWSRETVGNITAEVHGCDSLQIGNVTTNGDFDGLLDGEAQQGNALLINPTTDTNSYIIYFVNSPDQTFRQAMHITKPGGTNNVTLADSVTNLIAFTAQDFSGNVLTNNVNNRVIHLTLEIHQPARYLQGADYYKIETSVTRRALHVQ